MWKALQSEDEQEKARIIQQSMEAAEIRSSRGKRKEAGWQRQKEEVT